MDVSQAMNAQERKRLDLMEIKCLRTMCGVRQVDHIRNASTFMSDLGSSA